MNKAKHLIDALLFLVLNTRIKPVMMFWRPFKGSMVMVQRSSGELSNIVKASRLFKVLGNPKRLQLIYLLIQHPMSVSEISQKLDWEQSGVSHQLQLLRQYHLVQQHRHGKVVIYHLDDPQVMTLIADVLSHADKILR